MNNESYITMVPENNWSWCNHLSQGHFFCFLIFDYSPSIHLNGKKMLSTWSLLLGLDWITRVQQPYRWIGLYLPVCQVVHHLAIFVWVLLSSISDGQSYNASSVWNGPGCSCSGSSHLVSTYYVPGPNLCSLLHHHIASIQWLIEVFTIIAPLYRWTNWGTTGTHGPTCLLRKLMTGIWSQESDSRA